MSDVIYTLDPSVSESGYTRNSLSSIETHYNTTFGNKNLVTNDHQLHIRVVSDVTMSSGYSFTNWNTGISNNIEMYGWDGSVYYISKQFILNVNYANMLSNTQKHVHFHHLTLNNISITLSRSAIVLSLNGECDHCIALGNWANESGSAFSIGGNNTKVIFCAAIGCKNGFLINNYYEIGRACYNCIAINCVTGFDLSSLSSSTYWPTAVNCTAMGCTSNWTGNAVSSGYFTLARNNAGESGDTIPDTVGSTSIVITDADFADYDNDDFHITETSKLRHTHVDYPSGNNQYPTIATEDIDGDTLPSSYSTDDDCWDTGYDYWVPIVTGITWKIKSTEITDGEVTVSNATELEDVDGVESDSTLGAISSSTNRDTLRIVNNVTVYFSNYSSIRGFAIDIQDGEIVLENTASAGMYLWGLKEKNITVHALGKLTIAGEIKVLGTVSTIAASDWTTFWGTDTDDNSEFPEPSVIFIGSSLIPYFNKGGDSATIADDATHGRFFNFNTSTGAITFPDNQPTSTDTIYIYNIMLHSRDGQDITSIKSFGFSTTEGGVVNAARFYTTGAAQFSGASQLILNGFGILQPLSISECSNISVKIYRAISASNPINGSSIFEKLFDQNIGSFYGVSDDTVLILLELVNCAFDTLWCETIDDAEPFLIGGIGQGTDNCSIDELYCIGGQVRIQFALTNNLIINTFYHSNDPSGSNSRDSGHCFFVDTTGARGITIGAVELLENGLPTQLDIVHLTNCGNINVYNINYPETIRSIIYSDASFAIVIAGVLAEECSQQVLIAENASKNIAIQNVVFTSVPGSPAVFNEFNGCSNITLKNVGIEDDDRYLGWASAIPDLIFQELNQYGSPYSGVLVVHFHRTSTSVYTFVGTARSDKTSSVKLPIEDDSVTVTWPYPIKVGDSTSYFANTAPTIVGTNASNFIVEYRLNINGAGYGSWTTLSAANLYAESFTENDEFLIQLRATCTTSDSDNEISQIVIATTPDETVVYPVDTVNITLQNVVDGSRYRIYNETTSQEIAEGIQSGTADIIIPDIAYNGSDEILSIYVRKATSAPLYKSLKLTAILNENGATVYVSQVLDA